MATIRFAGNKLKGNVQDDNRLHCFFTSTRELSLYTNISHFRLDTTAALKLAQRNIMDNFAIVGILERYRDFLQILEYFFPRFFKGIVELYDAAGEFPFDVVFGILCFRIYIYTVYMCACVFKKQSLV